MVMEAEIVASTEVVSDAGGGGGGGSIPRTGPGAGPHHTQVVIVV